MKNAIEYGNPKPKFVVLDTYTLLYDDKYPSENIDFLHSSVDSMPLTVGKYKMLKDIIPENYMEFLIDLYQYHNRWDKVELKDLEVLRYFLPNYHGLENGAIYNSDVQSEGIPQVISADIYEEPATVGKEYLIKIMDLCDEEGIKLLIINLPYNQSVDNQKADNWVRKYANERGIMFYDILRDDSIGIDFNNDYCGAGHFNTAGAPKVSRALANYMLINCSDWLE